MVLMALLVSALLAGSVLKVYCLASRPSQIEPCGPVAPVPSPAAETSLLWQSVQ